jgi:hypothetical protein
MDYKKRFFEMPLDLQELSPKPEFDTIGESNGTRIPKLAVRRRSDGASPAVNTTAPSTPTVSSVNEKDSLRSSDDGTFGPPSPNNTFTIAPWEQSLERKTSREPRSPTTQPEKLATTTNDRHSSEAAKQPFRHEVYTS